MIKPILRCCQIADRQRTDVDLPLAGFRLAFIALPFHACQKSPAVRSIARRASVAGQARSDNPTPRTCAIGGGIAVVHQLYLQHRQILRQRARACASSHAFCAPSARRASHPAISYSLVQPSASAEPNAITGCGLKPCGYMRSAAPCGSAPRCKKRCRSRCEMKRSRGCFAEPNHRPHMHAPSYRFTPQPDAALAAIAACVSPRARLFPFAAQECLRHARVQMIPRQHFVQRAFATARRSPDPASSSSNACSHDIVLELIRPAVKAAAQPPARAPAHPPSRRSPRANTASI